MTPPETPDHLLASFEWAAKEIIVETCIYGLREPECMSCQTIGFFESVDLAIGNTEFGDRLRELHAIAAANGSLIDSDD